MTETIQFWATVASPIVGVIAIIVALIISHSTSKKIQKQVDAVYDLMSVFVASQNPTMLEAKKHYEQQMMEIDGKIKLLEEMPAMSNPFQGNRLDELKGVYAKNARTEEIECLKLERKEVEDKLNLILSYLNKAKRQNENAKKDWNRV